MKWLHLNRCKIYIPDTLQPLMTVPRTAINQGSELDPSEASSDGDTCYTDASNELAGESIPNELNARRSARVRKSSEKLIEAQWLDDLMTTIER